MLETIINKVVATTCMSDSYVALSSSSAEPKRLHSNEVLRASKRRLPVSKDVHHHCEHNRARICDHVENDDRLSKRRDGSRGARRGRVDLITQPDFFDTASLVHNTDTSYQRHLTHIPATRCHTLSKDATSLSQADPGKSASQAIRDDLTKTTPSTSQPTSPKKRPVATTLHPPPEPPH